MKLSETTLTQAQPIGAAIKTALRTAQRVSPRRGASSIAFIALSAAALMPQARGAEYLVDTPAALTAAVNTANANSDSAAVIKLTADIDYNGALPVPAVPMTIDTQGFTLKDARWTTTNAQTVTLAGTIVGAGNHFGLWIPLTTPPATTPSSIVNNGSITAAEGGGAFSSTGANVNFTAFLNNGTVKGGADPAAAGGGAGISAQRTSSVTNNGLIEGGDSALGDGGVGVSLRNSGPVGSVSTLTNNGIIRGGQGAGASVTAAAGVQMVTAGLVSNGGTIEGGSSAVGISVEQVGAEILNTGTIRGGMISATGERAAAIAVSSPTFSLSLELQGTSIIEGDVVAGSTLDDVLRVSGTTNGTLNVAQYQNFDTIEKTGSSTWTLTGASAAPSAWQIQEGTLQLGDGGTSGSILGDVLNNGVFVFNRSDALTYDGVVTGTGSIHQIGAGSTMMTGAGSHTSMLDVQRGTLELASGASLEAATINVAAGSTLRNGGTLTGTAADNTFTIAGTFAGAAELLDGNDQVQIADGATIAEARFDGGAGIDTLELTSSGAVTLPQAFGVNFERFTKRGDGVVTLAGTVDGFSDMMTVAAGELHLDNASVQTNELQIDPGAIVTGTGSLSGTLHNAGRLAPGNSPGTIQVGGNYVQEAGGVLLSEITREGTDHLAIAGSATLAGTHQIAVEYGLYLDGTTHTLISADGGISGKFDSVEMNSSALIQANRELGANAETVTFTRAPVTTLTTPNSGQGRYAAWLDEQIDAGNLNPELTAYVDMLFEQATPEEVVRLLRQQAEPVATVTQNSVSILGAGVARTVFDRFSVGESASCVQSAIDASNCFWAHGLRQWGDADGDSFGSSYDWTTDGGQIGVDRTLSSEWSVGATFAYADGDIRDGNGGSNELRTKLGGLYANYSMGRFDLSTIGFYSDNKNETVRSVQTGTDMRQARAEFGSDSYGVGARLGYRLTSASSPLVRPFIEAFYDHLEGTRFSERDGGAGNLTANVHYRDGLRGTLGLQLAQDFETHGTIFRPTLEIGVTHQFGDNRSTIDLRPAGDADSFRTYGSALDRTAFAGNAAIDVVLGNATLSLGYGGEVADDYGQHEASFNFRFAW
ncbi:MAG TPA: autotransporter domain-containing protein [Steroidobacteraceae bacterium]|jgi:uncharacterized protein with beta-barrel porin domain